jgi:exopolysaccharide production protein ExoY
MLTQKTVSAFPGTPLELTGNKAANTPRPVQGDAVDHRVPPTKLAFDKSFALVALILLAPVMAAIALAIRVSGAGPVIYGHTRIGHSGRAFRCLKFRSMRPGSDGDLDDLLRIDPVARAEWHEQRKLERDPRVDRLGHFLRKSSLDELPQFWNVLKGEMSIVGPRPITADEAVRYGRHFAAYKSVRPGLTGIWQVSGRSDASYSRRVALDVAYIRNWSLSRDIDIALRTVRVVLVGRGAI